MKRIIVLLIYLGIVLFIPGCSDAPKVENNEINHLKDVDLSEYMESIVMPRNMSIVFDPSGVLEKTSAKVYSAAWLNLDPEKTADYLLRFDILSTEHYAQGPWFEAGDGQYSEYLTIYNDVVKGGLAYSYMNNENDLIVKLYDAINPSPENVLQRQYKTDYDYKKDLGFSDYAKALAETEKVLTECGLPAFEVQEAYAFDVEMLRMMDAETNGHIHEWSEEDESYLMLFRQTLDDIPLINTIWEEGTRDWDPTETYISVFYSKDGVIHIHAGQMYSVGGAIREDSVISAAAALQILLDDYSKAIQISETRLVTMELNYVGVHAGEMLQLIPSWVIGISKSLEIDDEIKDEYSYFVINALTGEHIRKAVEGK